MSEDNADEILARAHAAVAALKEGYRAQLVQDIETLRACLHALDAMGAERIAVSPIPDHGLGRAINDRLRRAAAPRP